MLVSLLNVCTAYSIAPGYMQVQVLLRLYTSLLPHVRHVALLTRPAWAGSPHLQDGSAPDLAHDALEATIKREAAAVLNIGRAFHSEGIKQSCKQLSYVTTVLVLYCNISYIYIT